MRLFLCLLLVLSISAAGTIQSHEIDVLVSSKKDEEALVLLERFLVQEDLTYREEIHRQQPNVLVAENYFLKAYLLQRLGRSEEACQAATIAIGQSETDSTLLGQLLDLRGRIHHQLGRLPEAKDDLSKAVLVREAHSPLQASLSRDHLGLLFLHEGNYYEAGKLLLESLAATPEDNTKLLAHRQNNAAKYFHALGDYEKAVTYWDAALLVDQSFQTQLSRALSLSRCLSDELKKTALLTTQRLAREAQSPDQQRSAFQQLGVIAKEQHQYALAEEAFLTCSELAEGSSPLNRALLQQNLGAVKLMKGEPLAAHALFNKAVHILESETNLSQGRQYFLLLEQLAIAVIQSNQGAAIQTVEKALRHGRETFRELLQYGGEKQGLLNAAKFDLMGLALASGKSAEELWDLSLATKGKVFEAFSEQKRGAQRSLRSERIQREREVAQFEKNSPLSLPEEVRSDLAQHQIQKAPTNRGITLAELKAQIPKNTLYVEYVRYRDLRAPELPSQYGALILERTTKVTARWVPLTSEAKLEKWLNLLRRQIDFTAVRLSSQKESARPSPIGLQVILSRLHGLLWAPLGVDSSNREVLIRGEGLTHLIPWAYLGKRGKPLCVELPHFQKVTSWELPPDHEAPPPRKRWTGIGLTQFGGTLPDSFPSTHPILPDLKGVKKELRQLEKRAKRADHQTRVLLGKKAAEATVKTADLSGVVHLATHGFYLPQSQSFTASFFESGLVLAEAVHGNSDQNGLLFSHEILNLNLAKNTLVVLSACDMGLGRAVQGEGVIGLPRSLHQAGAPQVVFALWSVSDSSSLEFFTSFYEKFWQGTSAAKALWQTQKEFYLASEPLPERLLRYGGFTSSSHNPF